MAYWIIIARKANGSLDYIHALNSFGHFNLEMILYQRRCIRLPSWHVTESNAILSVVWCHRSQPLGVKKRTWKGRHFNKYAVGKQVTERLSHPLVVIEGNSSNIITKVSASLSLKDNSDVTRGYQTSFFQFSGISLGLPSNYDTITAGRKQKRIDSS